jgi:type III secretion protein S
MNYIVLSNEIYSNFRAGAILAGIPVAIAVLVGVVLAILQAATQIQDQTLPAMVKVIVILGVYLAMGQTLSYPLYEHTRQVFSSFHLMTR